jgi:hypothetical protein
VWFRAQVRETAIMDVGCMFNDPKYADLLLTFERLEADPPAKRPRERAPSDRSYHTHMAVLDKQSDYFKVGGMVHALMMHAMVPECLNA